MKPENLRIGIGHDTHRLVPGGPLVIGGIEISHDKEAHGHSDADVLLHAITDAILGAADLGDIGQMFPNNDPANLDRDSSDMLRIAWDQVREFRFQIINLDCIVFLQKPKLAPHRDAMKRKVARVLGLSANQIGIKAKTGEGVDAVGEEKAIQAQCVALLYQSDAPLD